MERIERLVSIISPCYNGEKYIENFLDSLLNQTYPEIELLFVDDASTDCTSEIIKSYVHRFDKKGYSLIYIKQDVNRGQSAAINAGLKMARGEYIAWIDSDDMYYPNAIEERVNFLKKNEEIDFVLSQGEIVDENNVNEIKGILRRVKPCRNDNLFKDLLDEQNVVYGPGSILVRMSSLRKAIPNLFIYESREGQNWQLMLPLAYCCSYDCIDKAQFKYVVHGDSHSHCNRTYKQLIERRYNFYVLQKETIKRIPNMPDEERYYWLDYIYSRMLFTQCSLSMQYFKIHDYYSLKKELYIRNKKLAKNKELNVATFLFNRLIAMISLTLKSIKAKIHN